MLDGTDDHVNLDAHVASFSGLTEGTISSWVRTTGGTGVIFSISDTADIDSDATLRIDSAGHLEFDVFENNTGILEVETIATINDGQWHHVAVTVNASGNTLYIDGLAAAVTYNTGNASTSAFLANVSNTDAMNIGQNENSGGGRFHFNGMLDDVRVYDRALVAGDVTELADYSPGDEKVRDNFDAVSFSGNDGDVDWSGDWIEVDAGGAGAPTGNVIVTGSELRLTLAGSSAAREADLSGATSASFRFDFRTGTGVEASDPDSVIIEVSDDGGATWTTLEDINYLTGANSGSKNYDISAYMSVNTQIRFQVNNGYGGADEFFYVDDVRIDYVLANAQRQRSPPTVAAQRLASMLPRTKPPLRP